MDGILNLAGYGEAMIAGSVLVALFLLHRFVNGVISKPLPAGPWSSQAIEHGGCAPSYVYGLSPVVIRVMSCSRQWFGCYGAGSLGVAASRAHSTWIFISLLTSEALPIGFLSAWVYAVLVHLFDAGVVGYSMNWLKQECRPGYPGWLARLWLEWSGARGARVMKLRLLERRGPFFQRQNIDAENLWHNTQCFTSDVRWWMTIRSSHVVSEYYLTQSGQRDPVQADGYFHLHMTGLLLEIGFCGRGGLRHQQFQSRGRL
ncbi:hypothetical protein TIFTF001_042609 [Ficus carica]|uniref:Uncharacterized protein n=1 Tax=Ficus carica TaxID=3494 RepID=A0AA87ZPI8_FICCA|nr:hypothetical protein TIFTF001_042609 [Ficus carica]